MIVLEMDLGQDGVWRYDPRRPRRPFRPPTGPDERRQDVVDFVSRISSAIRGGRVSS